MNKIQPSKRLDKIPIDRILPNPQQPRTAIDETELLALSDSILEHGLINPIAVEQGEGGYYILIDGERRWRAARLAGLTEIEASVRPSANGAGEKERLLLAVVANLQRQDMDPVEEAKAYKKLSAEIPVEEIARLVGVSPTTVNFRLKLLEFEPEIQELYAKKKLPLDQAVIYGLLSLPDDRRVSLARGFALRMTPASYIISTCRKITEHPLVYRRPSKQERYADLEGEKIPSFRFAKFKLRTHKRRIVEPDIKIWPEVRAHAADVCNTCPLVEFADPKVCGECPLVGFLARLIGDRKE
jgi:ParB/RepB/Spo0J family partition protein